MSIDTSDPRLHSALKQLPGVLDWIRCDYDDARTRLVLGASGSGGLEELRVHLQNATPDAHFCFYAYQEHLLFLTYLPETLGGVKRARSLVHARQLAALREHQVSLSVNNISDISISAVRAKLRLGNELPVPPASPRRGDMDRRSSTPHSELTARAASSNGVSPNLDAASFRPHSSLSNNQEPELLPSPIPLPNSEDPFSKTADANPSHAEVSSSRAAVDVPVDASPILNGRSPPSSSQGHHPTPAENIKASYQQADQQAFPKSPRSTASPTFLQRFSSSLRKTPRTSTDTPPSPRSVTSGQSQPIPQEVADETRPQRSNSISQQSVDQRSIDHDFGSPQHKEYVKQAELARARAWEAQEAERQHLDALERERLESDELERREAAERLRKEEEWRVENARREREAEELRLREEEEAVRREEQRLAQVEKERLAEEERRKAAEEAQQKVLERQREHERIKSGFADLSLSGAVMLSGLVSVQGGNSLLWKQRWFEVSRGSLVLYKSQTDKAKPVNTISLAPTGQPKITDASEETLLPHSCKITFGQDEEDYYLFYTNEKADIDLLMAAVQEAAK